MRHSAKVVGERTMNLNEAVSASRTTDAESRSAIGRRIRANGNTLVPSETSSTTTVGKLSKIDVFDISPFVRIHEDSVPTLITGEDAHNNDYIIAYPHRGSNQAVNIYEATALAISRITAIRLQ